MEIRHQCGVAEKFWALDLFYGFDSNNKSRHGIEREIDSFDLILDGGTEDPQITYNYVQHPEEYEVLEGDILVKKIRYITVGKIAIFEFSAPRTGKVVAQLKEIE